MFVRDEWLETRRLWYDFVRYIQGGTPFKCSSVLCLVKGCSVQTLMSWQLDQPVRSKSNNNWLGLNSAGSSDFTQTGNGISPGSDDQGPNFGLRTLPCNCRIAATGSSSSRRDCQTSHVQQPLPIIIIIKTHTHKNHPAEPTRDDHGVRTHSDGCISIPST